MRKQPKDEPDPLSGITDPVERLMTLFFPKEQPKLSRLDTLMVFYVQPYLEHYSRWRWRQRVRRDPELRARIAAIENGTFDPVAWLEAENAAATSHSLR